MSEPLTIRVGCVTCRALRYIDARSLTTGWPYCCSKPMIARTLRALARPRPTDPDPGSDR